MGDFGKEVGAEGPGGGGDGEGGVWIADVEGYGGWPGGGMLAERGEGGRGTCFGSRVERLAGVCGVKVWGFFGCWEVGDSGLADCFAADSVEVSRRVGRFG